MIVPDSILQISLCFYIENELQGVERGDVQKLKERVKLCVNGRPFWTSRGCGSIMQSLKVSIAARGSWVQIPAMLPVKQHDLKYVALSKCSFTHKIWTIIVAICLIVVRIK